MQFNEGAELDLSQVSDQRGVGGRVAGVGGGLGVVGLIVYFLIQQFTGIQLPAGGLEGLGQNTQVESGQLAEKCKTGADANRDSDCRVVATINSIQAFWQDQFARSGNTYQVTKTNFFRNSVNTRCGNATSAVGPFYCPADSQVYIDLDFFNELRTKFGATGGPFVEAYVLAHEYGHHVQNLLGVLEQAERGDAGVGSDSVKVEIMADCLAGMWANGAVGTGFIEEISEADIRDGLDAAAAVGDDRIQERAQGRVDPESWTHGSAEQRQEAFLNGYRTGRLRDCNQF